MQYFQRLKTASGVFYLLTSVIAVWMIFTLRFYLIQDILLIQLLLKVDGGLPILIGFTVICSLWLLIVNFIKRWWVRILAHIAIFVASGGVIYIWWNHMVYEVLGANIEYLHIEEMTPFQGLKIGGLLAVLYLPSVVLSGFMKNYRYPDRTQLIRMCVWLAMCIVLAYPIQQNWWKIAYPIQPLANISVIPYAGSYHEAVKLFAQANMIRFLIIVSGPFLASKSSLFRKMG